MIIQGKKGGQPKPPPYHQNNLFGRESADVVLLVAGHPTKGLVNGAKSILLNGVPLQNDDETYNFNNVSWEVRTGEPDQKPFIGLGGVGKIFDASGVEIKNNTPKTLQINSQQTDRVIITLGFRLSDSRDGGRKGTSVNIAITGQEQNGPELVLRSHKISGIQDNSYPKSYDFYIKDKKKPYTIRVKKLTTDSTNSLLLQQVYFMRAEEVVETQFTWPNMSMLRLKLDASQFDSIPEIGVNWDFANTIKVPSNYNEKTGKYDGVWDGRWKIGMYSNPCWVFKHFIEDYYIGAGKIMQAHDLSIDVQKLYEISQYWDEFIDDGQGGKMPRASYEYYGQNDNRLPDEQMQGILSTINGNMYIQNGVIKVWSDMPKVPIRQLFTNANVVNSHFHREGSYYRSALNTVYVSFNDPSKKDLLSAPICIDDPLLLNKNRGEIISDSIYAIGVKYRAQAIRKGRWLIASSQMESETITFTTSSIVALNLELGDVIPISDVLEDNRRRSGCISKVSENIFYSPEAIFDNKEEYIELPQPPSGIKANTRLYGWDGAINNASSLNTQTYTYTESNNILDPEYIIVYAGLSDIYAINKKIFKVSKGDVLFIETIGFWTPHTYFFKCVNTKNTEFSIGVPIGGLVLQTGDYKKWKIDINFDADDACILVEAKNKDLVGTGPLSGRSRLI